MLISRGTTVRLFSNSISPGPFRHGGAVGHAPRPQILPSGRRVHFLHPDRSAARRRRAAVVYITGLIWRFLRSRGLPAYKLGRSQVWRARGRDTSVTVANLRGAGVGTPLGPFGPAGARRKWGWSSLTTSPGRCGPILVRCWALPRPGRIGRERRFQWRHFPDPPKPWLTRYPEAIRAALSAHPLMNIAPLLPKCWPRCELGSAENPGDPDSRQSRGNGSGCQKNYSGALPSRFFFFFVFFGQVVHGEALNRPDFLVLRNRARIRVIRPCRKMRQAAGEMGY